jgi:hypothetical protein
VTALNQRDKAYYQLKYIIYFQNKIYVGKIEMTTEREFCFNFFIQLPGLKDV